MPRKRVDAHAEPQAFQTRLSRPLKEALEQAAASNGRSANAELQIRLEQSFAAAEDWGGEQMLLLTRLWNAAFRYGGHLGAKAWGHPEWGADEWLHHPLAYRTARVAADEQLDKHIPQIAGEDAEAFESLLRELAPHIARGQTIEEVLATMKQKLEESR